jgi:hypothetical protein
MQLRCTQQHCNAAENRYEREEEKERQDTMDNPKHASNQGHCGLLSPPLSFSLSLSLSLILSLSLSCKVAVEKQFGENKH